MNTDYIDDLIESSFSDKRRRHTYGVRDTSVRLAKMYGADPEKARVCSLYHDMFRRATDDEIEEYIKDYGLDPCYRGDPDLAHGKMAAIFMKEKMGISDQDMLNAVSFHTTGRRGMSTLEKVIYLADAIEPARDYPSVGEIREIAKKDLDSACLMVLERSEGYLKKKNRTMASDSLEARDHFREVLMEKELDNKDLAFDIAGLLDKKKAEDVVIIDVREKSSFADYLIVASAGSDRQTESLADDCEDRMAELGQQERLSEGKKKTGWVLLDFGDIIVNIFSRDMRTKYDLERVWGDCTVTRIETEE